MTDLTKEQEAALVEALDGVSGSEHDARFESRSDLEEWASQAALWKRHRLFVSLSGPDVVIYDLTPAGRLLAQALKERDEARNERDHMRAKYDMTQQAAGLAGNVSVDRNRELTVVKTHLADIQRAMHSAGYKSAAAMLNPLLRGDEG